MADPDILFCEGPEDLAALREWLKRRGCAPGRGAGTGPVGEARKQSMTLGPHAFELRAVGGRPNLFKWPLEIRGKTDPPARLALSFDPNGDGEPAWRRELFEKPWGPDLPPPSAGGSYLLAGTEIIPVPWQADVPVEFGLPDKHCLERLLVASALAAHPELRAPVQTFLAAVKDTGRSASWKTAARTLHAALHPEVAIADLASKVFGQDTALWAKTQQLLAASPTERGLEAFLR